MESLSEKSQNEKRINLKKSNGSSSIHSNSNNKMSNYSIESQSNDDLSSNLICPKPNQVSNCVLYGIPIVSLYIENQERLCLAQISNTLLKQFSYNEIHNRRVALGITCVQCTPVQLEILRRAGAMPVSSRRCGMITRREAERLCKSFLGDNSPPRLPDDFSFAVFHECAWGCRGAFLPSRYNSSRAKCIKCSYCGLFFSPNKFIFHSHRLSPNDKYVQPDAANFNSWRRHLKLLGSPEEHVTHAWEDVKAMFNGGTRKRLMSSPSTHVSSSPNYKIEAATPSKKPKDLQNHSLQLKSSITKNIHHENVNDIQANQPSIAANHMNELSLRPSVSSSAVAVASATTTPFNQQDLPFSLSRSFMIDYVWHQQQQQQQQQHSQSSSSLNAPIVSNKANFQFPPYSALNWIKQPSSFLFKSNNNSLAPLNITSKDEKSTAFNHFHSAAFKPVINVRFTNDDEINSTSVAGATNLHSYNHSPTSSTSSNNNNHHATTSSTNQSDDERFTPNGNNNNNNNNNNNSNKSFGRHNEDYRIYGHADDDNDMSEQMCDDDENEVVDIETTEDDIQINRESVQEEIKIADEIMATKEHNNNIKKYLCKSKSPIKEILTNEHKIEDNDAIKKSLSHSSAFGEKEWTFNLKKEPDRFSEPSHSYIHKIHAASSQSNSSSDGTSTSPTKLWSIARLSVECTNNSRTSLYHQLKGFHATNDISHSNI